VAVDHVGDGDGAHAEVAGDLGLAAPLIPEGELSLQWGHDGSPGLIVFPLPARGTTRSGGGVVYFGTAYGYDVYTTKRCMSSINVMHYLKISKNCVRLI
jgi:hypothetical protein